MGLAQRPAARRPGHTESCARAAAGGTASCGWPPRAPVSAHTLVGVRPGGDRAEAGLGMGTPLTHLLNPLQGPWPPHRHGGPLRKRDRRKVLVGCPYPWPTISFQRPRSSGTICSGGWWVYPPAPAPRAGPGLLSSRGLGPGAWGNASCSGLALFMGLQPALGIPRAPQAGARLPSLGTTPSVPSCGGGQAAWMAWSPETETGQRRGPRKRLELVKPSSAA